MQDNQSVARIHYGTLLTIFSEKSLARFMKLEEKCGEATQQIIGGLEELQVANKSVINNLKSIIREHDEVTAVTKAARKPLFPKLPMCLEK